MADKKENTEWKDREIGALWVNVKQGSDEKYLAGQVNGEKVILFKNKYKDENPKSPDFVIYKQKDQGAPKESAPQQEQEEEDLI